LENRYKYRERRSRKIGTNTEGEEIGRYVDIQIKKEKKIMI
jgi:hypothetical protein